MPDLEDIEFCGERFRHADEVNEYVLMEFAESADEVDAEVNPLPAMAAVMRVVREGIHPDDLPRFRAVARKNKATVDQLMEHVLVPIFTRETGRPTVRPSVSSDGLPGTGPRSTDDSSLRVIGRLEGQGRPDLALMVALAQESRAG